MGFLANLTLSRSIILLSFVGSGALGYLVFQQETEIAELRGDLDRAQATSTRIQTKARELALLHEQVAGDHLGTVENLNTNIQEVGKTINIDMPQLDVSPDERETGPNIVDSIFTIRPASFLERQRLSRVKISNFLYRLEERSNKVRVTYLELVPSARPTPKPHEVAPDEWTFTARVTTREKTE